MEIVIAEEAGFCFGVRRALQLAQEATAQHGTVFSVGPLIHNHQVVQRMAQAGLQVAEDIAAVPDGAVAMIRAHGAGPETYQEAKARGIQLIDATCPFVTRVQQEAAGFAAEGYQVLVLGEPDHPEPRAIVAHTGGQATIVSAPDDLETLDVGDKVAVVSQTTQRLTNLQVLVAELLPRAGELRVANTICEATTQRQQAAVAVARQADLMIVVGGYHSANTRRLAEICQQMGTTTYHIETAAEIEPEWFRGIAQVGVTGGASTPPEAIEAVAGYIRQIAKANQEG